MKNFSLILLLSMMSFTASAATLNINEPHTLTSTKQNVTSSQPSLPTSFAIDFDIKADAFADGYTEFNVFETHPNGGNSDTTFSQYSLLDSSNNILSSAALAGVSAFSFAYQTLADSVYTLQLFGTLGSSPTRVHLTGIAQTPIPAALFLMAPLLMGAFSLRRKLVASS